MSAALGIARRFAEALDADDFAAVVPLLAPDCVYDTGKEVLIGPEPIVESYRRTGEDARRRLDRIEYQSNVVAGDGPIALIQFTDRITHRGETHVYCCRQRITVGKDERITAIRHEELPGERERLLAFFARVGVDWS